ncbi:prolipoprotein diacylglyceryl transferase [Enterococcus faecium]|uniref:prolipoprotein diacylglyceryl transferase n=1 Tax=Enterococcus faecium TaxID=1352 RepID=UPI00296B2723|nr:prolipoprotein diacylglyceryl transferase [Enterococcus faecium]MDW3610297.1 prolipoprotein diacylglyceryl transferase [Enterococcus faecium]
MGFVLGVLNPHVVEIGSVVIHWYGVIIAAGILAALQLSTKEAKKKGLEEDTVIDMALWEIPIGLLGARLYYVLFELGYYLQNPGQILAIYGGLIAGGGTLYWYAKKKGTSLALVLDILAPNVLLAQSIGRWGNFMNQEAHGGPVTRQFLENLYLPEFIIEQMNMNGTYYHPTFLYESLWSLLGFVLIVTIRNRKQLLRQGEVALSYVLWYSVGRFFIEGMRTDSLWIGEWIRVSQALSLALFIGAIVVWFIRRQDYPPISYYSDGNKGQKKTIKMVN